MKLRASDSYPPNSRTGDSTIIADKHLSLLQALWIQGFFFILEHVVYILYSPKYQKNYTGESSFIISSFHFCNTFIKKGWTIKYRY